MNELNVFYFTYNFNSIFVKIVFKPNKNTNYANIQNNTKSKTFFDIVN